jgi:predicted Fe-Mo cluster-binding NifX family protein
MKVCIPIKKDDGLESMVYGHFGSAPAFLVYDTNDDTFVVINNQTSEHVHGQCNPVLNFRDYPIDVMISEGIGIRALQKLHYASVQVLKTQKGLNVRETLDLYKADNLEVLSLDDACAHHH